MIVKQASPAMIQQQIYTRERSGLFRGTEGFDTVAASDGLDSVFIKKQLHPFCVYDAPAELASRAKEAAGYPPAIHLFHTDGGDTVLGRSIYQPVDFTGLRSAFLTHNYVIPAARRDEIVIDYSRYFEADYAEKYFQEIGRVLPELEHLPQRKRNPLLRQSGPSGLPAGELLDELKLDEKSFKQLLFAVMTAVGEGRKKYMLRWMFRRSRLRNTPRRCLKCCSPVCRSSNAGALDSLLTPRSRRAANIFTCNSWSAEACGRVTGKSKRNMCSISLPDGCRRMRWMTAGSLISNLYGARWVSLKAWRISIASRMICLQPRSRRAGGVVRLPRAVRVLPGGKRPLGFIRKS